MFPVGVPLWTAHPECSRLCGSWIWCPARKHCRSICPILPRRDGSAPTRSARCRSCPRTRWRTATHSACKSPNYDIHTYIHTYISIHNILFFHSVEVIDQIRNYCTRISLYCARHRTYIHTYVHTKCITKYGHNPSTSELPLYTYMQVLSLRSNSAPTIFSWTYQCIYVISWCLFRSCLVHIREYNKYI